MHAALAQKLADVATLCRRHKVRDLYEFGSVTRPERFGEDSDIDLLVRFLPEMEPYGYVEDKWALEEELQALLGRSIDLMTVYQLTNRYFIQELNQTAQRIYGPAIA